MPDVRADPRLRGAMLLDVRQVADLLGISTRTVWRLAATGDIPAPIRIGERIVRWRAADLEHHLGRLRPQR